MPAHAKPPLPICERHLQLLHQEHGRKTGSRRTHQRIAILLNAAAGKSNFQIGKELCLKVDTVDFWRNRWQSAQATLQKFEEGADQKGVSDRQLLIKLLELLKDAPGRGRPKIITLEQERQITALACEDPKDHGVDSTQWSQSLLAKAVVAKGIIGSIAGRTIGSILKKTKNAPTTPSTGFSPK